MSEIITQQIDNIHIHKQQINKNCKNNKKKRQNYKNCLQNKQNEYHFKQNRKL